MTETIIKIYIAGNNTRSRNTIAILKEACTCRLGDAFSLIVIDIIKLPELAEAKKILAIPTIACESVSKEKRVIGELKDLEKAVSAIDFLINDLPNHIRYAER